MCIVLKGPLCDWRRGAASLLLGFYQMIITCNMTGAAGGAGHAYLSGSPNVPHGFYVGVHIA